ncbi:DUF732 domain-containing protein [Mycobacterium sp. C31M]
MSSIACGFAAMLTAAPASADNNSYLNRMNELGLSSELGPAGLLQTGKGACSALSPNAGLMFGRHPNWVAQMVWESNPMLERNEASLLVNAAIDNLCPGVNPFGYAAV